MAQQPSATDQTPANAGTAKDGQGKGAGTPVSAPTVGPQGSGDSPKPHGDPLKPVLEK